MYILPTENVFHFLCRVVTGGLSLVLIIGTALPFIRSDAWWIRGFDFPRIQIAILIALTLAGYAAIRMSGTLRTWEHVVAGLAGLALLWQLYSIAPYTKIYPHEMSASQSEDTSNRILAPSVTRTTPPTVATHHTLKPCNHAVLRV